MALKILPEAFAADPDRLARFQREAQVLASLNHPNIAAIHGLEESDGVRALVLELVEGPTLADRIAQSAIPLDEALPIAKQIAEAIEAAHEAGVIHRDLKPANIKVRDDGTVKVLDFGLAKALEADPSETDPANSPTITAAATRAGVIMGTAAYMSPEQAAGKPVDQRSDIWALGVVLWEMLTGRRLFTGESISHVLASMLKTEPDYATLPLETPEGVRRLLRRCLERDRRERLQHVGDARVELKEALSSPDAPPGLAARAPSLAIWQRPMPAVLSLVVVAAIAGYGAWSLQRPPPPRVARFVLTAPPSEAIQISNGTTDLVISPDGTQVVYSAGTLPVLYARTVDQLEGAPLRDTDGGGAPFFSPDGSWVGFFADGLLKKVPLAGGPSVTICPLSSRLRGASWGPDDTIVFAAEGHGGLLRVSANGGEPETLTTLDEGQGEIAHRWPEVLPGGQAVLFTSARGARTEDREIALLNLASGGRSRLIPVGSNPHYSPTGHIVYGLGATLRAVSFDLDLLAVTGDPVPVLQDVMTKSTEFGNVGPQDGAVNFSLAQDGSLVYVSNVMQASPRNLVWVDRQGREEMLASEPLNYAVARISPDGTRVAIDRRDEENDIWILDLARETMTQLTFDPTPDFFPVWTPDGRVVFSPRREGARAQLFVKAADGTGVAERLTNRSNDLWPMDLSPDGKHLVMRENLPPRGDLFVMAMEGEHTVEGLVGTPFGESAASISPDGRWLAYHSDESGQAEVYVRPFPDIDDGKWLASANGGTAPRWNPEGGELFHRAPDGRLMSVPVSTDDASFAPRIGRGRVLFEATYLEYDVAPDGQRFLAIKEAESTATTTAGPDIILVQDWFSELERLVPKN